MKSQAAPDASKRCPLNGDMLMRCAFGVNEPVGVISGPGRECLIVGGSGEEDMSIDAGASMSTYAESRDSEWRTRRAERKLEGVYFIGPVFMFSSSALALD